MTTARPPLPETVFSGAFCEGAARLRLSRADVAHRVGVTVRTVSRWRMGDLLPHADNHARLLAAFEPAGPDVIATMRSALGLPPPAPPPAAPPAPPPRDVAALRKEVELALHAAAEELDRSARRARRAVIDLLATLDAIGVSAGEARGWLEETERQSREARARPAGEP